MLEKLSYGIVTHHGSMPLTARLILEHFTQRGFCRICFATSTLLSESFFRGTSFLAEKYQNGKGDKSVFPKSIEVSKLSGNCHNEVFLPTFVKIISEFL